MLFAYKESKPCAQIALPLQVQCRNCRFLIEAAFALFIHRGNTALSGSAVYNRNLQNNKSGTGTDAKRWKTTLDTCVAAPSDL
jgi:hypothetical protein